MRLLLIVLYLLLTCVSYADDCKKIAITIDDVPMKSGRVFNGIDRTKRIIQILRDLDVKRVGLFVVGTNITKSDGEQRLKMYDEAGHMISNHTYSHPACRKTDEREFIENIIKCHEMIKSYENFSPFFRFPYLDECKKFPKRIKNIQKELEKLDYKKAYVTIVTIDYYLNALLQKALQEEKEVDYKNLRNLYLQMVLENVNKHDKSLKTLIGYRPVHNLLLHENDISALYLGDVINLLRDNGWTIVDPEEAFANQDLSEKTQSIDYNVNSIIPYYRELFNAQVILKEIT